MKQLLTTTLLFSTLMSFNAFAGSNNEIDLELIGDDLKPSITQDGSYNKATMKLKNTKDDMKIIQNGNNNEASMQLNTGVEFSDFSGAAHGAVTINQTGDGNKAKLTDGGGTISKLGFVPDLRYFGKQTVTQEGNGNTLEASIASPFVLGQTERAGGNEYIQIGNANSLKITNAGQAQNPMSGGWPKGSRVYSQIGDGNTAQFDSTVLLGHQQVLDGKGFSQEGNGNTAIITGAANSIRQKGNANQIVSSAQSDRLFGPVTYSQEGDFNSIGGQHIGSMTQGGTAITQTGDGNRSTGNLDNASVAQLGDNNINSANLKSIALTQLGQSNITSGTLNGGYLSREIKVTQDGYRNSANFNGSFGADLNREVKFSSLSQKGERNDYEMSVNGSNNVTVTSQEGINNGASQQISGNNNLLQISQIGDNNAAIQRVEGNLNELSILQNGFGNHATQAFKGDSNKSTISQTGANHTAAFNITGSNNNLNVTQEGVGQKFSLTRVGSGMNLNITQK